MNILTIVPRVLLTLAAVAISAGCDTVPEELDEDGLSYRDTAGGGGPIFNTNVIDTSDVPAVDTHGLNLDGVRLISVRVMMGGVLMPVDANSLFVDEGVVNATVDGIVVEGADFLDSEWKFRFQGNPIVTATVADVETSDDAGLWDPNPNPNDDDDGFLLLDPDRLVYTFTYLDGTSPVATCAYDSVAGARAVLYGDIHVDHDSGDIAQRDNTIYFGCISGAIGKAALHGYAPDSPTEPSVTLPEFETSTRALRADYCGDGTSFTQVGNPLTYQDHYGIHTHTEAGYSTEAIWEAGGGAVCVNRIRRTGVAPADALGLDCGDGVYIGPCGPDSKAYHVWDLGAYLWTMIPNA